MCIVRNTVKGFRLDDNVLDELKNESREKRITLNNHVNNVLARHNEVYRNLHKLNYIWSSPEFIKNCLDFADEKNIEKLGKILFNDLKNQIRYCQGDISSHGIMNTIESNCLIQNIPVNVKEFADGSKQYMIIHKLGHSWGMIQKYALENLVSLTNSKIKDMTVNDDHMSFTIVHK